MSLHLTLTSILVTLGLGCFNLFAFNLIYRLICIRIILCVARFFASLDTNHSSRRSIQFNTQICIPLLFASLDRVSRFVKRLSMSTPDLSSVSRCQLSCLCPRAMGYAHGEYWVSYKFVSSRYVRTYVCHNCSNIMLCCHEVLVVVVYHTNWTA